MSTAFAEVAQALKDNQELSKQVMAAGTPAERAEILKAAGLTVPTNADVQAHHAGLDDVSGAGVTTDVGVGIASALAAA